MNSNIIDISQHYLEPNKFNTASNFITYDYTKKKEENDKNKLKNLRIETSLSLRKKKLNELLFLKRKIELNHNNNDDEIYVDFKKIINNIPKSFVKDFDISDNKLLKIHQFLSNDHGTNFDELYLTKFVLYKLTFLSYDDEDNFIYEEIYQEEIKNIFYDLIKLINESKDKQIIYGITTILVNFLYSSKMIVHEFKKVDIWRRLAEISEFKIPDMNDNIVTILSNYYSGDKNVGKEYILSGYSRYIKQILINFFKTFIEESNKENIDLNTFLSGIHLISKLIKNENGETKNNDFDVVVKMKFIYEYVTKAFLIASSWLFNDVNSPKHEYIFKFISDLLQLFSIIATYINEETYQMQEFRGESFVSSFCSLLKFLIANKEKRVSSEYILSLLEDLYNFIGIFYSIDQESTLIYSQNKIIIITEEFIKNINLMKIGLITKIIFFLSNYAAENEKNIQEIFEESCIFIIIKDYIYNNIIDNKLCYNFFCLIDNVFKFNGNNINNCKILIIENCCKFLIERIKIFYELVISKSKEGKYYLKFFLDKCELLLNFVRFLRNTSENKLQLLKIVLEYIINSNLEGFIENIHIFAEEKEDQFRIDFILKELKKL